MSAFVDTSALYALLVQTEARHHEVVAAFSAFLNSDRTIHTTSFILVEATALLQNRIGLGPVRDLHECLLPLFTVQWVSSNLYQRGMQRLLREDRRRLSLVDCISMEHMSDLGLTEVLGLDQHFAEAGFQLVPGPA